MNQRGSIGTRNITDSSVVDLIYLDSNVFILPALYKGPRSERAVSILEEVVTGKGEAATCALTLDEVIWIISGRSTRDKALKEAKRIMEFPNLKILDVKQKDIIRMIELLGKYPSLAPRDGIHLGVCLNRGIGKIVSDDSDFSGIDEIERIALD